LKSNGIFIDGVTQKKKTEFSEPPKNWDDLKRQAIESEGENIPSHIKKHPVFALIFLCVYPYRFNSGILRWLDTEISKLNNDETANTALERSGEAIYQREIASLRS
jgi:hypothetical protein